MITEALEENGITVKYTDPKKLKYFVVCVEALFICESCNTIWSSHHATIGINLYGCRVDKYYKQLCNKCINSWTIPKFTVDRFKEAIDSVIKKYWKRKRQDDDSDDIAIDVGNPHEPSLCERCMELGRPCW